MMPLEHRTFTWLIRAASIFPLSLFFYESHPSSVLAQIGMCLGPVLIFQIGIVILLSVFLANVVRGIACRLQKSDAGLEETESRGQRIALVSFVLFVILGCASLFIIYRDLYIP